MEIAEIVITTTHVGMKKSEKGKTIFRHSLPKATRILNFEPSLTAEDAAWSFKSDTFYSIEG